MESADGEHPLALRKLAAAVECFHKASLIHDDIEDGDDERYGEKTLHAEVGVPMALNVGDFLLGEGYRLIAEAAPAGEAGRMIAVAAKGHRTLCLGQGSELEWANKPEALATMEVLSIFKGKTAPAFDVALKLGAHLAGASDEDIDIIENYSESLGIAYQIRDDLDDFSDAAGNDITAMRPSLLMASALERVKGPERDELAKWWRRDPTTDPDRVRAILTEHKIPENARLLLESFKERAVQSLRDLGNESLKGLLRRIMGKIFNDAEIGSWCKSTGNEQATVGAVASG